MMDEWPNVAFADALRAVIGDRDTVLAPGRRSMRAVSTNWRANTRTSCRTTSTLEAMVEGLNEGRIFDLHKCAANNFYHPGMGGRTSIKVVLDALWKTDSAMRDQFTTWNGRSVAASDDPYHTLPALIIDNVEQDVREGTGAIRAYEAMMYGIEKGRSDAKQKWRQLLLQYCELDTLSMVLIFEYWRRITGLG